MSRWDTHGDAIDLTDDVMVAWVAGLLEGEGSFKWKKRHGRQRFQQPQISIQMCDEDVILRLGDWWGAAVHGREPAHEHWRQAWETTVGGRKAVLIMRAVLPHMGQRRAARIREILEEVAPYYDNEGATDGSISVGLGTGDALRSRTSCPDA